MASVFSGAKTSEIAIKIDPDSSKISVEGKSAETGENVSEIKIEAMGPSQEIVFNARYLLDGINTISTLQIAILANNNSAPVALKGVEDDSEKTLEDYIYIVMPIKN
jgi:DNA polymerase III sliding clamp (beta) subunit (PCNA family)